MALSSDLISQFVKITKDETKTKSETIVYGTVQENTGYVKIDGAEDDILTPVSTTTVLGKDDRVTVMIKNHAAIVTGNLTKPSARADDTISIEQLYATNAEVDNLKAANADIQDKLSTKYLTAEQIDSTYIRADELDAKYITAEELEASYITAEQIDSNYAKIGTIESTYATIESLDAVKGNVTTLNSEVANIDTLIFGSATGNVIQTSFSNAVIAQLGDAQIKSAMIESVSADKITAGDIITNNVRVMSEDGSLIISDETLQINDGTRVRVQIGKDAANDYSINIWDQNGELMFSKGGIADAAIKDAIIRNDMVSETANIHASKLDIDSLFEEINGSTNTIKSTQVYLNDENQTLDVAFTTLETTVTDQDTTISSQGTAISAIQGQISSKIWQQDITTAVDNIEIGGRNLLPNTGSMTGYDSSSNVTLIEDTDGYIIGSFSATDTLAYNRISTRDPISFSVLRGKTVTFSVLVKSDDYENINSDTSHGLLISFALCGGTSDIRTLHRDIHFYNISISDSWSKISVTETLTDEFFNSGDGVIDENTRLYISVYNYSIYSLHVKQFKLEIGNKATDWTPAIEDVATITDLTTKYTEVNQTIDTISATVASHTTQIADKADNNTVTAVNDRVTNVETSLDSFKTTVSNTYTTKTEFNDLQVGGRNLVRGSSSEWTDWWIPTADTNNSSIVYAPAYLPTDKKLGDKYTISFDIEWTQFTAGSGGDFSLYAQGAVDDSWTIVNLLVDGSVIFTDEVLDSSGTKHVSLVREVNRSVQIAATKFDIGLRCNYSDGTGKVRIKNLKVEKGNKETDWTPAPEDTQNDISDLQTRVTASESSITQLSDKITTNVTETTELGTRMSSVEQNASSLTARLTTAETGIKNAAKTATNYLNFSDSGLVIGDITASTLGKNVLIDSDSVDICEGDTILASFGSDYIHLGKNSRDAKIDLCNGLAQICHTIDDAGYSQLTFDTTYGLSSVKISAPRQKTLTLENANSTNGVLIEARSIVSGSTPTPIGGFGMTRDGYMIRCGSDVTDDNPVYYTIVDSGNFTEVMDSGWKYGGVLGDNFTLYNNNEMSKCRYRKIGNIVEIRGVVTPTTTISGSTTNYTIFTLPEGYRPDTDFHTVCQGSGTCKWNLSVTSDGEVRFAKYSNETGYADATSGIWLPFQVTFFVD